MVTAADAVLRIAGYRVRGKTGSHEARFRFPGLPPEFLTEQVLIDRAREARNLALYEQADLVSESFALDVLRAAELIVEAAHRAVGGRKKA